MNAPIVYWGYFAWRPFGHRGFSLWWNRPVLFSERQGIRKVRRFGRLAIEIFPARAA